MHTAKTINAVATAEHPLVQHVLDRRFPLDSSLVGAILSLTQFTWHGRRPKPSVTSAGARKTNLDLLSLLVELYRRQARVTLQGYKNKLPWKMCQSEQHVGGSARFGKITGLISHKEHMSFSVRIHDESVRAIEDESVALGKPRTYMIADYNGHWHNGWSAFDWDKTEDEISYLERRQLMVEGEVSFEDYLHLNRRQSVYGAPYLLLKLLLQRIEDELKFCREERDRLEHLGFCKPCSVAKVLQAVGPSRSVELKTFVMEVKGPKFAGQYQSYSDTEYGYDGVLCTIDFLENVLRPSAQFVARADEVAFCRFGLPNSFVASWVKGTSWKHDQSAQSGYIELHDDLSLSYQTGVTEKRIAA